MLEHHSLRCAIAELVADAFIGSHLRHLSEQLLEANLARLIEPFSCVEISHASSQLQFIAVACVLCSRRNYTPYYPFD